MAMITMRAVRKLSHSHVFRKLPGQILFPFSTALLLLLLTNAQARPPSGVSTTGTRDSVQEERTVDEQLKDRILEQLGFQQPISPQTLAYNISKEEYLRAYSEYMANVRRRRQQSRGEPQNAVERRKKAQILVQSFYPQRATTLATLPGQTVMTLEFNLSSLTVRNTQSLRLKSVVLYSPPTCHSAAGGHAVTNATHDSLAATTISSELTRWLEKLRWRQAKDTSLTGDAVDELFTFPFLCSNSSNLSSNDTSSLSSHFRLEVVSLLKPFPRQRRNIHSSDTEKYALSDFADPNNSMEAEIRQRRLNKRNPSDCTAGRHGKACCRKPLTVSLKDLKIPESILAPHEIQLGYCEGRCTGKRLPFDSNWAIFRNILFKSSQQQGKKALPRLCCVPTKFDDLDVIQFHPEKTNELKVTVIHNALVKECGCS